ncbi:unnamed protein product [Arabidopsis halleri]
MGWWWRKRNKKRTLEKRTLEKQTLERGAKLLEDLIEFGHGISNPIKFFSADEILKATNNFSDSNLVSPFHYYRKWYSVSSMVSGHKNFLKLVGCCLELEKPVLVYHGVKKHYQLEISEQPWKRRMKIAEDSATALAYLHTAFPRPFVYTSLSIGDILLDEDGVAKLTDFSFCVSIPEGETFVQVDLITGTFGHMDAKYTMNGVVSEKTDVFAFGILLQKFLMGEKRFWNLQNGVVSEKTDDNEEDGEGDDDDNSYASAAMSEINDQRRQFSEEAYGEGDDDDDDSATMWRTDKLFRLLKFKEEHRMDEIVDSVILEKMGEISEQELCQMNAFWILSLRCIGPSEEVPTMVEVAKELKKIQTSLINDSSSPSGETNFDFAQDISSSVVLSNQTINTKALLPSIACQVFHEMFQWVMLSWFRFFRKKRRMC